MPKWLSSLLIAAGFFALVGLAFFPRTVEVNIEITDNSRDEEHYAAPHDAPAPIAAPEEQR